MVSNSTEAILSQMKTAGKPRTTTQETTQEQPVAPIDIGSLAMILAMLLGQSKPAGDLSGAGVSEPTLPGSYGAPQLNLGGSPMPTMGGSSFSTMDPFSILSAIAGVRTNPSIL